MVPHVNVIPEPLDQRGIYTGCERIIEAPRKRKDIFRLVSSYLLLTILNDVNQSTCKSPRACSVMHHMNITLIQLGKPTFCSHNSLLDIVRRLSTNLHYFYLPDRREIFIVSTYISSDFFLYLLVLRHRGIRLPYGYFLVINLNAVL